MRLPEAHLRAALLATALLAGPAVAAEAPDLAARVRADADRELPDRRLPAPLLDGNALLAAGFRAGPQFKVLLDLALDAQIEGRVRTTAEALELARAAEATAP